MEVLLPVGNARLLSDWRHCYGMDAFIKVEPDLNVFSPLTMFCLYFNCIHCRDAAQDAMLEGEKQLAVLTRQSVMSRLYPSASSVMESPMAIEK